MHREDVYRYAREAQYAGETVEIAQTRCSTIRMTLFQNEKIRKATVRVLFARRRMSDRSSPSSMNWNSDALDPSI